MADELDDILLGAKPQEKETKHSAKSEQKSRWLASVRIVLNEACMKDGVRKKQFQYVHLDSDGPECGLYADGTKFVVCFTSSIKQKITVVGRNLEEWFDRLSFHTLPELRVADRDFPNNEPMVKSITIEEVKEEAKQ